MIGENIVQIRGFYLPDGGNIGCILYIPRASPASCAAVKLRCATSEADQRYNTMKKSATSKPAPKAKDLKPKKDAKGGANSRLK